jgi:glutamate-1-semialdehyde 2,1-aminomutase
MATFFFNEGPVRNYEEAKKSDTAAFGRFFHHSLERGVYLPPSQFEAMFVSTAHTPHDIAFTKSAISEFAAAVK